MSAPSFPVTNRRDLDHILVERAIAEFRAGRLVMIAAEDDALFALGVEGLDAELALNVEEAARGRARLVLPAARLRRLGLDRQTPGSIALPTVDLERIATLALRIEARVDAPVCMARPLDLLAIELARLAHVCPAVLAVPVSAEAAEGSVVMRAPAQAIESYRRSAAKRLTIVSRAPVPLEGAKDTEFVVFRGGEGLRDQVAVIIGTPDVSRPVTVRLHSACLTGDLFGSLKCDCGDQLRDTVKAMARGDGGIVLYLDQEGRGNGIANKMKAYRLQAQGFDTYDADEVLGFDLDQRRFDFAAEMLRQLGVTAVRILTNNPEKIRAVAAAGLEVVGNERVLGRLMPENVRYLSAKRDRAGHIIDVEALAGPVPERE